MTTVEVHACEHCLTRPAVVYDTYADEVLCRDHGGDPDTSYGCQFMLSYIPRDLPVTIPARPTIEVEA